MSLQLIGTNQTNSTLLAYDGGTQQVNLFSTFGAADKPQNGQLPGFNGERPDPLTGTSHLGNGYRAYNPILMRFNCPDSESPFGVGGINPYAYCEDDPVNFTDPSGHGILKWFTFGFSSLFRHLFADETADAFASTVAKTTSNVLTYGTQVSSALTNYIAYAVASNNPQAAMKLEKASYALGIINSVSTLYSSFNHISKKIKASRINRSLDKFMKDVKKSLTKFDELGNVQHTSNDIADMLEHNLANNLVDEVAEVAEELTEEFLDTEINIRTKAESVDHGLSNAKLLYETINFTASLTSTVFNIASESIRKNNPQKAEDLSYVSSIFGNIDLGMGLFGTIHGLKEKVLWIHDKGRQFHSYAKFKISILKLDSSSEA